MAFWQYIKMKCFSKNIFFLLAVLTIGFIVSSCKKSKCEKKYYNLECQFPNNYTHNLSLFLFQYDKKKILLESTNEGNGQSSINELRKDDKHVYGNISYFDHNYPLNGVGDSYDFMSIYYLDGEINKNIYTGVVTKKLLADSVVKEYIGTFKIDFNEPIK